ncbi:hypothetical protein [Rhizobium sp. BE258]|uniref:hypothetical protein n=1 Tax=Rhizobium sp. BE258 TaxID=2817722 RepID=UPI00286601F3|nr:hypothetical protein [Rhizobium sp. BE258]MDR7148028.1 hypothetical protein [Rhizobium sp. BE258]
MAWSSEFYQFAVFTQPHEKQDAFQVWLDLFGSPPDNYQKATPDPLNPATQATGTFAGYQFQVQCAAGRIDVFLLGTSGPLSFPVIASAEASLAVLREKANALAASRSVLRLALINQSFEDHQTLESANLRFSEVTDLTDIPDNAQDLNFGINVRKSFDNPTVALNRLCRWISMVKQMMQIQIGPTGAQEPLAPIEQPSLIFNLDLNTVIRPLPFNPGSVSGIIEHLFAENLRLKEKGYEYLVE